MKQVGGVDEEGFYFLITYDTKNSQDMKEMTRLLGGDLEANPTVKHYGEDRVEVIVRPSWEEL